VLAPGLTTKRARPGGGPSACLEGTSGAEGRAERLERCSDTRSRLNLRSAGGRSLVAHAAMSSTTSTGGWAASSSRTRTTRSVLAPSGIVSPAFQLGTVLASVGGSAGRPSDVSSVKTEILPPSGPPLRLGPSSALDLTRPGKRDLGVSTY
jgi:hypothetical protein